MSLFLPEIALLVIAFITLCLMLVRQESKSGTFKIFIMLSAIALLAISGYSLHATGLIFNSTYKIDGLSQGFKCLLVLGFLFTIMLWQEHQKHCGISPKKETESTLFLITSLLGMMMMTSSVDILTLYISMELSSYSLYLLSVLKTDKRSAEASVKYFIFGAATSGIFLWGASLVAGVAQSTSIITISKNISLLSLEPAFVLGLAFMSFAFLFKLSSFPLQFWAPDIYESAPTPVTTFIATTSKAAAVAILVRIFMNVAPSAHLVFFVGAIAFISMTVGNSAALLQKNVKRLLAYSSIAQAGYILLGILPGSSEGFSSLLFYAVAYLVMNAATFLVVTLVAKSIGHDDPQISDFDGLADRSPFMALILLLSLLSLAGIPPLVGFTGKWILFSAAMQKGHWFLVLWAVLNSVVSLFYYLTLVKHAYLEKPKTNSAFVVSSSAKILGLILFCAIVFLGVFPNPLIEFTQHAIQSAHF